MALPETAAPIVPGDVAALQKALELDFRQGYFITGSLPFVSDMSKRTLAWA